MSTAADPSALTADGTAEYKRQVDDAAAALREIGPASTVGILRDLDLDGVLPDDAVEHAVPYDDLPHYPASDGVLRMGTLEGTRVVELNQDLHLYAGHTPREVTFPVRMLAAAGVDTLLVPATAGSVAPEMGRGGLMLLTDHINFQGQNPLVGPNVEAWGPRFPDMTEPYDAALQRRARDAAQREGIALQKGVYLGLLGPHQETAAEHRMARRLGADVVGTSVVPEVIAARHMGVDVMGLVLLTTQHLSAEGSAAASDATDPNLQTASSQLHRLLTTIVAG